MNKYLVVRGKHQTAPSNFGNYCIYGVFNSNSSGTELELEMQEYARLQMYKTDKVSPEQCQELYCNYIDLSFPHGESLANSSEYVVERPLSNIFYGFIRKEDIDTIFSHGVC